MCLFKVHKLSQSTDSIANSYSFKCFSEKPAINTKKQDNHTESALVYHNKIEELEQKIKELKKQSEAIIASGDAEAKAIIENANREAANILNTSSIQGYKKGLELANKKTEEIIRKTNANATKLIDNAQAAAGQAIDKFEGDILNFSLAVAKKILNLELDRNDEVIGAIIKNALKNIKTETTAKVCVSSEMLKGLDNSGLRKAIEDEYKAIDLTFVAGNDMKNGEIVVETEKGSIDAGINSQFARLKGALQAEKTGEI